MKTKKVIKIIFLILLMICMLFTLTGCDLLDDEDDGIIENVSEDTFTLMIYMCGADLESDGGYASDDIDEMLEAQLANEVNLLIYTGGALEWYNDKIADGKNQIFKVEDGDIVLVDDSIGTEYMYEPDTLTYFLNYSKKNYPAKRYGLIFWDHGGGAIGGFGYDENGDDEEDSLTIDEMKYAFDRFNNKIEFIGFDACLMGTVETAYALRDSANYLIASEETEPGTGWQYKKLLNQLSRDTSQDMKDFGKVVVDSFIKSNNGFFGSDATLSMIDLRKMKDVYSELESFMVDVETQIIDSNNFATVSKNITDTKSYADGEMDMIDLIDFANKMNVNSSEELINSINDCVVYNSTTDYIEDSNGLSIYFPNDNLEYYESMGKIYRNIGFSDTYINVLNEYVNVKVGGKQGYYTVNNMNYSTNEDYEQYDWFDSDIINYFQDFYDENTFDSSELEVTEKNGSYSLHLTDEQWEDIVSIQSGLWYDDGEGYIDLGTDSYYEFDDDGDLSIDFDGTWIAINGNVVYYEVVEQTDKYEKGKVPVLLNDKEVDLVIYWDYDTQEAKVLGAETVREYEGKALYGRGYTKIKPGDKIEFLIDYYDYDGNYDDSYIWGDPLIVDNNGLEVSYEEVGDGECIIYYILTDIYDNVYYTEPVIVY